MGLESDWVFGTFRLDPAGRQLWQGTTAVPLRPKLFAALQYLVEHAGRLITREELLRAVWSRTHVDETLLRGTMRDLRAALDDDAEAPRFIETIPHQGYRFLAEVRRWATTRDAAAAPEAVTTPARGLIEREREGAQLAQCLERALNRQRQLVFVTGEPGIGKTTLVDAFVEGLPNRHGVIVGRGQCVEQYGGSEAYLPVLEAIGQLCRHRAGKRVLGILNQYAPTWLVQLPALLTDGELDALQRKTQGAGRDRMLREMAEALEALSVEMPVALVFEDLHWSDHSTLDLLGVLARRREPARLLVVGTYRPTDVIVSGHPLRAMAQELQTRGLCEEVPLEFLSEPAVLTYLSDRFGATSDDTAFRSLAHVMYRRTDGNPLFMVTIADDLVARGVIAVDDGVWHVQGDDEQWGAGVPDGLKPLIDRQFERLALEDQRLLEAASVAGCVFSAASVAAALEATPESIDERCEGLGRRGTFIAEADGHPAGYYTFLHDLFQRALYDRLSASRRARLHRRIAEFEAQAPTNVVRERAAQLAVHYERGGDAARAIDHLRQAATNALGCSAIGESIALLERARQLVQSLPPSLARDRSELAILMALAGPLSMAKGSGAAEMVALKDRAEGLLDRLGDDPDSLPARLTLVQFHYYAANHERAAVLEEPVARMAQSAADPWPIMADLTSFLVRLARGDLPAALTYATRTVAAYDPLRHGSLLLRVGHDPGVVGQGGGAFVLGYLGYPDQARRGLHETIARARRVGGPIAEARGLSLAATGFLFERNVREATTAVEALTALVTQHELSMLSVHLLGQRGWLLLEAGGDAIAATQLLQQNVALLRQVGMVRGLGFYLSALGASLAKSGRTERAHEVADDAIAFSRQAGELVELMQALVVKGRIHAESQEDSAARGCFDEAIALARRQSAKALELRAVMGLARIVQRQGRPAEAKALVSDVYNWFTEGFDTPDLRDAKSLIESFDRPASRSRPRTGRVTR